MKKLLLFVATAFFFSCNNETPSGATTSQDSTSISSPVMPPSPDGTVVDSSEMPGAPDTLQRSAKKQTPLKRQLKKRPVSAKAKIDSIALRQNQKLPLHIDN